MKQKLIVFILFLFLLPSDTSTAADKFFNAIIAPFPPFTSVDLENKGVAWDICKTALEIQGYEVTATFAPWARALDESKAGNYDGLLLAYWTEQRTQWFAYPTPLVIIHTGFMKHKDRKDLAFSGDLKSLAKYNIGVGTGYSVSNAFDRADYLNKIFVPNTERILKMLWFKRLDVAAGGLEYSLYYLNKIDNDPKFKGIKKDIIIMGPPLKKRYAYMVIPIKTTGYKEKVRDFNIGMQKIMINGQYSEIINRHNLPDLFNNQFKKVYNKDISDE